MAGRSLQHAECRLANLTVAASRSQFDQVKGIGLKIEKENDGPAFSRLGPGENLDRVILREADAPESFTGKPAIASATKIQCAPMCRAI